MAIVAEIKRRSPSAGAIADELDPVAHAAGYVRAGASAVSVLTNEPFFGGSLRDLERVAATVPVPLLRKDFILDELQIVEARAHGASAVLLIVRVVPPEHLASLIRFAREWQLDPVVEVHTAEELAMALDCGADILGVNSRDLETFAIDTSRAWQLLGTVPADRIAIAESGMASRSDVAGAAAAGADAVLVGTAFSSLVDPESLVGRMTGVKRRGR